MMFLYNESTETSQKFQFFETFFSRKLTYLQTESDLGLHRDEKNPDLCLAALKKGDKAAFAHFVRTYQEMVFACCKTAGLNSEDIEDAASESFWAAYRSLHRFDGKSKLGSWLWTIAYRKASDIRRKNHQKDKMIQKAASNFTQISESVSESKEQSDVIWDAVGQLPEKWAAVVVLFYRESRSINEIAEILNIPANTVKTYLDRARKRLYELLEKYWKKTYVKI